MLNVSAIPLTDISPIWDDGFLSLSKNLLSAVTLDDFIKKLNRIDACFGGVTRVNLILNLGAGEEALFYFMGEKGPKHLVCAKADLHFSREQAIVLPVARFHNRCELLAAAGCMRGCTLTASCPSPRPAAIWGAWSSSARKPMPSRWRPWPS